MRTSQAGIELIEGFEGFPQGGRPYRDIAGVWTIGYGHTEGVGPGTPGLTPAGAEALLRRDLAHRYEPVIERLGLPLAQHQFDALVSFVYNVGPGAVAPGTAVGRALRAHDWHAAADHLLDWDKARVNGHVTVVAGLRRRRQAERALFLRGGRDALAGYAQSEVRWIREYDRLRRSGEDPDRRRVLRRVMRVQRKRIWRAAQPASDGGDGRGWEHANRRRRYGSLLSRSD